MEIITKGKVIPSYNTYHTWKKAKTITIDLKAKRAEIFTQGGNGDIPVIILDYNKETLYLEKNKLRLTEIEFPEFKGWTILVCCISKYSLTITFVKM